MKCVRSSDLHRPWSIPSMIERLELIQLKIVRVYSIIVLWVIDIHLVWIDPGYGPCRALI